MRRPSATVGWVVYFIGWLMSLVVLLGFPYDPKFHPGWRALFDLFPWNVLTKAFQDLDLAAQQIGEGGLTWKDRSVRLPAT